MPKNTNKTAYSINIDENNQAHLDDFIRLNEEWITTYFELESADKKLAENPGAVIDNGGYIFSLMIENKVVTVCALFNEGKGIYELARMAVSPQHHGKGYGECLMQTCLSKLQEIKASKVYLVSNTKLTAAISLYKKHGFQTLSEGRHPRYSRANIMIARNFY